MKRIYNQIPYMENLGKQVTTSKSHENVQMESNRPVDAPYRNSWPAEGWLSQMTLNYIRHCRDVKNSIVKRENKTK